MIKYILTLSIIFLHEGFSYYLSFQTLAIFLMLIISIKNFESAKNYGRFVIGYGLFLICLVIKSQTSPLIIDQDGMNIERAVIGILGYAFIIISIPHIRFKNPQEILENFRKISMWTIIFLALLLCLSDLNLFNFLNREALLQQNTRLVENWAEQQIIDQSFRINQIIRHDLFYGESSALAVVLFACLGCFVFSSKGLNKYSAETGNLNYFSKKNYNLIIIIGLLCLFYIQSFSANIYGVFVFFFCFIKERDSIDRIFDIKSIILILVVVISFSFFTYEYFLHRLTQQDSQSFDQRFGLLSSITIAEVFMGLDESRIPYFGRLQMQNGCIYIVAISGLGGLTYILVLIRSVYLQASSFGLSLFSVFLILGIMMQNMGIFSPNKMVIMGLVLIPLACCSSIVERSYSGTSNNHHA